MLHADVISFFVIRKYKKYKKSMKIFNIEEGNPLEDFQ